MLTIDLSNAIATYLDPILVGALASVAMWVLAKLGQLAHFQISQGSRDLVTTALTSGVAFAQTKLGPVERVGAPAVVAEAANYVLGKVPAALNWLFPGQSPAQIAAHVAELVTARLPA